MIMYRTTVTSRFDSALTHDYCPRKTHTKVTKAIVTKWFCAVVLLNIDCRAGSPRPSAPGEIYHGKCVGYRHTDSEETQETIISASKAALQSSR